MKLHKLKIEGFRKILNAEIIFGDATFLIGENNVGKSTVLSAIEYLLSDKKKLEEIDYSKKNDNGEENIISDEVVFTAEFRNVPEDIISNRGFDKKRLITYKTKDKNDSGLAIIYRKTYKKGDNVKIEMQLHSQKIKEQYQHCITPKDFVDAGIEKQLLIDTFGENNYEKKISSKEEKLNDISEIFEISSDEKDWVLNPGGIPGNVLSKLPRYLLIPAEDKASEIGADGKSGTMIRIMNDLFTEVRDKSDNYKQAQEFLNRLSVEMNPQDETSEFGKMILDINHIIGDVFPNTKINAFANLNDPNAVLKPLFQVSMFSNVSTPVQYQGTGIIRAAVFSLLRFMKSWEERNYTGFNRGLIIGFEEPEIYLHPNAANKMRNTIYELAVDNSQIICTTHSPYMIDFSQKPRQVLNSFTIGSDSFVSVKPFNLSDEFQGLHDNDKDYIKLLQKIDDHIAKVFFAKRIIIVEGDTDEIVLKGTIDVMPKKNNILSDFQIIKAGGKAAIIALAKYLRAMKVSFFVIHDRDDGVKGAVKFNAPILEAIGGDENNRLMMCECIENELGYVAPSSEKPYEAYKKIKNWKSWDDVPDNWKNKMGIVFKGYVD